MRMTLRRLATALAGLLLAWAPSLAACPACAGSSSGPSIWSIVGAFLLVPPALAGAVIFLIRRENRSGR